MLSEAGLPCERVIDVDGDSILYENKRRRARTAWLHRLKDSGLLKVRMEEGFIALPPPGWHER